MNYFYLRHYIPTAANNHTLGLRAQTKIQYKKALQILKQHDMRCCRNKTSTFFPTPLVFPSRIWSLNIMIRVGFGMPVANKKISTVCCTV